MPHFLESQRVLLLLLLLVAHHDSDDDDDEDDGVSLCCDPHCVQCLAETGRVCFGVSSAVHSLILLLQCLSLLLILLSHVFGVVVGTTGVSVSARDYYNYLFSVCSPCVHVLSRARDHCELNERKRELCTLLCSCRRPSPQQSPPTLFSCRLTVVLSTPTQLFDSNFWLCVHGSSETLFLFLFRRLLLYMLLLSSSRTCSTCDCLVWCHHCHPRPCCHHHHSRHQNILPLPRS